MSAARRFATYSVAIFGTGAAGAFGGWLHDGEVISMFLLATIGLAVATAVCITLEEKEDEHDHE